MSVGWPTFASTAVAFLVVFVSGFRLSRSGAPYGTALLAVHKLVAVVPLALAVWTGYESGTAGRLGSIETAAVALAGLSLVALIVSGGVLSAIGSPPAAVRRLHRIAPYASVLLTAAWLYLAATAG